MSIIASFSRVGQQVALKNFNIKCPKKSKIEASICLKNHAKCKPTDGGTLKHLCYMKYQPTCVSIRRIHCSNSIQEKEHFRESESASSFSADVPLPREGEVVHLFVADPGF